MKKSRPRADFRITNKSEKKEARTIGDQNTNKKNESSKKTRKLIEALKIIPMLEFFFKRKVNNAKCEEQHNNIFSAKMRNGHLKRITLVKRAAPKFKEK